MIRMLRTAVPAFWMGLLVALSFIETPLKFLASDITLPIALGIGRLVLTAANIAGGVLFVALVILSLARPRVRPAALGVLAGIGVAFLVQVAIVRPQLNARTDIILAGGDPGPSALHVVYIVLDVIVLGLLVAHLVLGRERAQEKSASGALE